MFLEIATTLGALAGAFLAITWCRQRRSPSFSVLCSWSRPTCRAGVGPSRIRTARPDRLASRLRLDSTYPTPAGPEGLPRASRAARLRHHVRGRHPVWAAGHRLGGLQGPGHGPGHAPSLQGIDDDEQLHDRRDRRRQRRGLPEPGLHRSRHRHAGHARGAGRLAAGHARARSAGVARAADRLQRGHRGPGHRDDLQGFDGEL